MPVPFPRIVGYTAGCVSDDHSLQLRAVLDVNSPYQPE